MMHRVLGFADAFADALHVPVRMAQYQDPQRGVTLFMFRRKDGVPMDRGDLSVELTADWFHATRDSIGVRLRELLWDRVQGWLPIADCYWAE